MVYLNQLTMAWWLYCHSWWFMYILIWWLVSWLISHCNRQYAQLSAVKPFFPLTSRTALWIEFIRDKYQPWCISNRSQELLANIIKNVWLALEHKLSSSPIQEIPRASYSEVKWERRLFHQWINRTQYCLSLYHIWSYYSTNVYAGLYSDSSLRTPNKQASFYY